MEPVGHLSVELKDRKAKWSWCRLSSEEATDASCLETRMTDKWDVIRKEFLGPEGRLNRILDELKLGKWDRARAMLDSSRVSLTEAVLDEEAEDFLYNLAGKGQLILIDLSPESLPLELIDMRGEPFSVRYRTLYVKRNAGTRGGGTVQDETDSPEHESRPRSPCSCATFAVSRLTPRRVKDDGKLKQHMGRMSDLLARLYGADHRDLRQGRNLGVEEMREQLAASEMDCLYHLGHGLVSGPLKFHDGALTVRRISNALRKKASCADRGFAFLNACWSASTGGKGLPDVARALLGNGYRAVVGTVLPPLLVPAARTAETFFESAFSHRCDLVEMLYDIQCCSWKCFANRTWEGDLAWACFRLYVRSPDRRFLSTRVTDDLGNAVLRTQYDTIPLGRLTGESKHSVTAEQLEGLATVIDHASERKQIVPDIMRALLGDRQLESLAEVASKFILHQGSLGLAMSCLTPASWDVMAPSPLRKRVGGKEPSFGIGDVDPDLCLITSFRVSNKVSRRGERLCLRDIVVARQVLQVGRKGIDFTDGGKNLPPEVQMTVRVGWLFARRKGEHRLNHIHLFHSALIQSVVSSVLPGEVTRGDMREHLAHWTVESDPAVKIPDEDEVTDEANGHLSFAMACQEPHPGLPERPFWWHLLGSLLEHDWDDLVSGLSGIGIDTRHLWHVVRELLKGEDASIAMPTLCKRGWPVGIRWSRLPEVGLTKWGTVLEEAASAVSQGEGPILLTVPWTATPNALHDAVCSELSDLARRIGDRRIERRHWIHVQAADLLGLPWYGRLKKRGSEKPPPSPRKVQKMLNEAREWGVLCLNTMEHWLGPDNTAVSRNARAAMNGIRKLNVPTVIFVSRKDRQRHLRVLNEFPCLELHSLSDEDLTDFVREWDRDRHAIPAHEDAVLRAVLDTQQKKPEDERLGWSTRLMKIAHEHAAREDGQVTVKHVESAIAVADLFGGE